MVVNKPALLAIILQCSGLQKSQSVFWYNDPNRTPNATDNATIKCRLRTYAGRGVDEVRYTYTPPSPGPENFDTTQVGQRDVVLSLVCEAWQKSAEAAEILDTVRTRLRRSDVRSSLLAINLALQTMDATIELPTTYDSRALSVASLDIHFGAISVDDLSTDTPADGDTWIETVDGDNIIPKVP